MDRFLRYYCNTGRQRNVHFTPANFPYSSSQIGSQLLLGSPKGHYVPKSNFGMLAGMTYEIFVWCKHMCQVKYTVMVRSDFIVSLNTPLDMERIIFFFGHWFHVGFARCCEDKTLRDRTQGQ